MHIKKSFVYKYMIQEKEYNFQYLLDFYNQEDTNDYKGYELHRIRNAIDNHVSNVSPNYIFHLVPVLYSIALFCGISTFVNMLVSRV